MFIIYVYVCGLISLVQSNQFQPVQLYPFGASTGYGSVYGSQPIVVQPLSSYNQQYTVQNPLTTYQTLSQQPAFTNQLQEIYLNKILSNPALQAVIDPNTKIYNQNGVEISDQIRPRGSSNVVNNYFIVPSDNLKVNETILVPKKKITDNSRRNNYNSQVPKQSPCNDRIKNTIQVSNKHFNSRPKVKEKQGVYTDRTITRQEYNDKSVMDNKNTLVQEKGFTADRQTNMYDKQRLNIRKQDQITSKNHNSEPTSEDLNYPIEPEFQEIKSENYKTNRGRKVNQNRDYKRKTEKKKNIKLENNVAECDEMFDINEECCELDCRNIRNPINNIQNKDTATKSSNHQNDFMKNWMNYVKTLMPDQTFESLDFSTLPYNFENMYQMPSFNFGSQMSNPNKTTKKRKQKDKKTSEQEGTGESSQNQANQSKKMTVELVPKFIEIEPTIPQIEELEKGSEIIESFSEIKLEMPSKVQPHNTFLEEFNSKIIKNNVETDTDTKDERFIPYKNNNVDYYPDFTKDAIYTTDEDDLYLFHNRHYYDTDDMELNRERRKNDPQFDDIDIIRSERRRINDIPSIKKNNIKDNTLCDETKFKTPPGLNEPGFQTKKIEMNDRGSDKTDFKPLAENGNNIETVFARSKVVKYGQQKDVDEKPKVNIEQENRNERYNNKYSKDGDTTVVFSKSWN